MLLSYCFRHLVRESDFISTSEKIIGLEYWLGCVKKNPNTKNT